MPKAIKDEIQRISTEGTTDRINVVLYGRISKDRANETSTETQIRDMKALCELSGFNVVGEFIDYGKSAYKLDADREQFELAMNMIETKQATKLIVWKLDRMSRNAVGFMRIHDRLSKVGADFQSVKEPWFDTSNPIGLALVMLMAALAEMEAEGIQARAIGYHEGRKTNGKTPTGPRPYGFDRPAPNTLVPNPKERSIVNELAVRIIKGESLRSLARELDARGIPTINGKGWNHTTIRTVMLSTTTIGCLSDGSKGCWDSILPRSMWDELGTILNDPNRTTHINGGREARKLKHLLPGIMTCGKCGDRLVTKSHKAGRQYGCESCELSIMADMTDDYVTEWIMSNVTEAEWQSLLTQGKGNDPRVIESIQNQIDELFIERATNPQRVSRAVYESTMATLESQLAAANEEPAVKVPNVPNLHDGWETMSNVDRRMAIEAVTTSITVAPYCKGTTGTKRITIEGNN